MSKMLLFSVNSYFFIFKAHAIVPVLMELRYCFQNIFPEAQNKSSYERSPKVPASSHSTLITFCIILWHFIVIFCLLLSPLGPPPKLQLIFRFLEDKPYLIISITNLNPAQSLTQQSAVNLYLDKNVLLDYELITIESKDPLLNTY